MERITIWACSITVLLAGCDTAAATRDAGPSDAEIADLDAGPVVDDGGSPADAATARDAGVTPSEGGHVLYLNSSGGVYADPFTGEHAVPAFIDVSNGTSDLLIAHGDTFAPGWRPRREGLLSDVVERVEAIFAPFDVRVTQRRPPAGGYIEVLFAGDDLDRGEVSRCAERAGFARVLCGPVRESDRRLAHVLTGCVGLGERDLTQAIRAEVVAHEVGHSVGLAHIDDPTAIMFSGAMGRTSWGAGNTVDDGMSETCDRTTQDSAMLLLSRLGAARPRPPVAQPDDTTPPSLAVFPTDGMRVPPGTQPCAEASDDSALGHIHLEVYFAIPELTPPQYGRIRHEHAPGPRAELGALVAGASAASDLRLRYVVTDEWGNLAEERVRVTVDPAAPPAPCPFP